MGYVMVMSECGQCKKLFSYNPHKVPSLNNVAFCKECVDAANPIRVKNGLPAITYSKDAYEAIPEEEL